MGAGVGAGAGAGVGDSRADWVFGSGDCCGLAGRGTAARNVWTAAVRAAMVAFD